MSSIVQEGNMRFPHTNHLAASRLQINTEDKPLTIIAGCTALGAELAQQMSLAGFSILIIDPEPEPLMRLGDSFGGIRFEGDANNPEILKRCAIERAGRLFALFDDDATNVLLGKIAETMFNVPDVRVQIMDGANRAALSGTAIQAICPVEILTSKIIRELCSTAEGEL